MYFHRAQQLDPPKWMQEAICAEIENNSLTCTAMGDHYPPKEKILAKVAHRPELVDYVNSTYGTEHTQGYTPSQNLANKILEFYNDFLSLVPDTPKVGLLRTTTVTDKMLLHIDENKVSSLTCLISTDGRPRTTWWEPKEHLAHKVQTINQPYRFQKIGGIYPGDAEPAVAAWLNPWEMMLFDNNTPHSVEDMVPNGSRTLLTIGFINIPINNLIQIYRHWIERKADVL
jgi:hypothetical protein